MCLNRIANLNFTGDFQILWPFANNELWQIGIPNDLLVRLIMFWYLATTHCRVKTNKNLLISSNLKIWYIWGILSISRWFDRLSRFHIEPNLSVDNTTTVQVRRIYREVTLYRYTYPKVVVLSTDKLGSIWNLDKLSNQLDINNIPQIYQILKFELIICNLLVLTLQFVVAEYQNIINLTKRSFGIAICHSSLLANGHNIWKPPVKFKLAILFRHTVN